MAAHLLRAAGLAALAVAAMLMGGTAMAAGDSGGGLHGGVIAGIAISITLSALLLAGAAGYILPKPPKF